MAIVTAGEQIATSSRSRKTAIWLTWLVWSLLLGAVITASIETILFGRLPLAATIRGLFGNPLLSAVAAVVLVWWLVYARLVTRLNRHVAKSMLIPSTPILLGMAVPLLAIHLSDVANHYFYYGMVHLNQPKSLTILLILLALTVLLQSVSTKMGRMPWAPTIVTALDEILDPVIVVLFLGIGLLQATSYMPPPGQDFVRYWLIADAFGQGLPYAANTTADVAKAAAGMTPFIIDLPLYPAMMAAAFSALGHTVEAAYVPIALGNVAFPPLMFLLVREMVPNRLLAISLASLVALFPVLRFYALNWPAPESIFFSATAACALLYLRITSGSTSWWTWAGFGLSAAATTLSRPEGAAYAGIYVLGLLSLPGRWGRKAVTMATAALPTGVFVIGIMRAFGVIWPRNWAGTLRIENILGNLPALISDQFLTAAIRLSATQLALGWVLLSVLALIGWLSIIRQDLRKSLILVPVWVNILAVYMVDPRVSGAGLWFDFFRHVSYVLPLLVVVAGAGIWWVIGLVQGKVLRSLVMTCMNALLVLLVLWNTHALMKPSWNFGPDAVNLLSQERPNLIDFVDHSYSLPVISYDTSGTHSEPLLNSEFFSRYPDQLLEFYRPFDAVKLMSGTAYQTGSLYLYLAMFLLGSVPTLLKLLGVSSSPPVLAYTPPLGLPDE